MGIEFEKHNFSNFVIFGHPFLSKVWEFEDFPDPWAISPEKKTISVPLSYVLSEYTSKNTIRVFSKYCKSARNRKHQNGVAVILYLQSCSTVMLYHAGPLLLDALHVYKPKSPTVFGVSVNVLPSCVECTPFKICRPFLNHVNFAAGLA